MNVINRLIAPTPKFFRVVRSIGLCLAAMGGAILASPIVLPAAIATAGGYLVVAGSVATAVAQTASESDCLPDEQ